MVAPGAPPQPRAAHDHRPPAAGSALDEFRDALAADRWLAGRRLMEAVFEPGARRRQAGVGRALGRQHPARADAPAALPRRQVRPAVRDGRAVTAALLRKRGATDDRRRAFEHWMRRVRRSHAGLERLPPGSVETIMLEDFAAHDRERTFARLMRLLELEDPGPARVLRPRGLGGARPRGAWRQRIAPADVRWLDRRYGRAIRQLRREASTGTASLRTRAASGGTSLPAGRRLSPAPPLRPRERARVPRRRGG